MIPNFYLGQKLKLPISGGGGSFPTGFASHTSAAAGAYVTTGSYADYLTATITMTTGTNILIHVDYCGYGSNSDFMVELTVDGVAVAYQQTTVNGTGYGFYLPMQVVATGLSPGAHTVKARVKSSAGSHNLGMTYFSAMTVKEF